MKHKAAKKKSHAPHHKHHDHHKAPAAAPAAGGGGGPQDGPDGPPGVASHDASPSTATGSSHRGSVCEYCGGANENDHDECDDHHDHDDHDHDHDHHVVDVNGVTSVSAYTLRSPFLTAFTCQCTLLLSEIHSLVRTAKLAVNAGSTGALEEEMVATLRPQLVALFVKLFALSVSKSSSSSVSLSSSPFRTQSFHPEEEEEQDHLSRSRCARQPTCPFTMVLSVSMPTLHKLLEWIQLIKSHWWLAITAIPTMATTAAGPGPPIGTTSPITNPSVRLLATQLAFHDLLTHVVSQCNRLSALIQENEEKEQDLGYLLQSQQPQPPTARHSHSHGGGDSSPCSSSGSFHSSTHHAAAAPDGFHQDDERDDHQRLPQVKKISFEFEELLAEFKFELADLSEALLENMDLVATRGCRMPATLAPLTSTAGSTSTSAKGGKPPANEFVELLMQHALTPLSDRVAATPSISKSYIFPRLLDRCISVTINEYVVENGKWNEQTACHFEKAIELWRTWATNIDALYDTQLVTASRNIPRLNLASLDAFQRLNILLATWLRNGKNGDKYTPRLTFRTNLENIRSTIKRTVTARNGTAGGFMTPPPG